MKHLSLLSLKRVFCLVSLTAIISVNAQEKEQWENLLKDGSLELWEPALSKSSKKEIGDRWSLKDGIIHLDQDTKKGRGGHIWTKKSYLNFELKFEFKIAHNSNSGIKYRLNDYKGKAIGCEYQIIDDINYHRDNKKPTHRTACLYDLVSIPADRKLNPAGEWNTGRIIVSNNQFEHYLNGEKVMSIHFGSADWQKRFAKSKYKAYSDFAKGASPIMLTDHDDTVSYRNLLIREIKPTPTAKEQDVKEAK